MLLIGGFFSRERGNSETSNRPQGGSHARTEEKRAFHLVAEKDHDAVTGLLLDKDADINAEAESRWTAFYLAVYNGHEPVARLLLGRKTKLITGTNTGDPPLHKASYAMRFTKF